MIIFDASTLILIAKAELLDLFLANVSLPVAVPGEVERECCGSKKTLDAVIIQRALDESRIKTVVVRNRRLVAKLQADFSLGRAKQRPSRWPSMKRLRSSALMTRMGSTRASYWASHSPRRWAF